MVAEQPIGRMPTSKEASLRKPRNECPILNQFSYSGRIIFAKEPAQTHSFRAVPGLARQRSSWLKGGQLRLPLEASSLGRQSRPAPKTRPPDTQISNMF
ncbi:MAG: hypothetical protein C0407_08560 [Desulfobacca sp.]|nr:hypothetical protein [Desulfobacca sp.]